MRAFQTAVINCELSPTGLHGKATSRRRNSRQPHPLQTRARTLACPSRGGLVRYHPVRRRAVPLRSRFISQCELEKLNYYPEQHAVDYQLSHFVQAFQISQALDISTNAAAHEPENPFTICTNAQSAQGNDFLQIPSIPHEVFTAARQQSRSLRAAPANSRPGEEKDAGQSGQRTAYFEQFHQPFELHHQFSSAFLKCRHPLLQFILPLPVQVT